MTWLPLNLHSQFSVLGATSSIEKLVQRAAELRFSAIALTDSGNLHGAVDFFKACTKANIKPLIGIEIFEAPGARHIKAKKPHQPAYFPITLIAKNEEGYRNLCRLSTLSYSEGFYYVPRIDRQLLKQCAKGLIALTGSMRGKIGHFLQHNQSDRAQQEIVELAEIFQGNLYLQLQDYRMSEEDLRDDLIQDESWLLQRHREEIQSQLQLNQFLREQSSCLGISAVVSQECYFLNREDWRAHQVLLNVCSGEPVELWQRDSQGRPQSKQRNPKRQCLGSHEHYLKTKEQMQELFPDDRAALNAPLEIADQCHLQLDFSTRHYPLFTPQDQRLAQRETSADILHRLAKAAVKERYATHHLEAIKALFPDRDPSEMVLQRLESEFEIIASKEMSDYLLIVGDFIRWAKEQRIPVGPGRGSGAGSILCYLIGITDIEPLRFQLFFERFINPERASYPDIDVDICMVRRSEVIGYMLSRYGAGCVAHIITFGKMKAKLAIKDVGRVLSVPLLKVNELTKLIPEDPKITLEIALKNDPQLRQLAQNDDEIKRLLELAQTVEGSIRNTGVHAAGVIIGAQPLVELIPLCVAKESTMPVAQYSMKPLEALGLLKIDFLGLKTLTCIQEAVDTIERERAILVKWEALALDDLATFSTLNSGKTQGIFQLESSGMQDLARNLHLDRFEEIIAVLSLYRPGPMAMIPSFINRKHGREKIELDHPLLEQILAETYGIMVYQEQVMQIAQKLAGYSLAEGDVLRRAMGKKDRAEMAGERKKFLSGAINGGIKKSVAETIFEKIERFAEYGFNKSHAAAYGYLTYVTAYLKAHFPAEWMAALMTHDSKDTERVADCIAESRRLGISILPPDVNESKTTFLARNDTIRFALSAVKGMGESAVEAIFNERARGGDFADLIDFIERIDPKKVGKRGVEVLIEVGAFDFTGKPRDSMRQAIEALWERAQTHRRDRIRGVISLFASEEKDRGDLALPDPDLNPRSPEQLLRRERELLGFYLTGNPLDLYRDQRGALGAIDLKELIEAKGERAIITAFIVEEISIKISQRTQQKFAILTISDGIRRLELPLWSDLYSPHSAILQVNSPLGAVVSSDQREGLRYTCHWLCELTSVGQGEIAAAQAALARAESNRSKGERGVKTKSKGQMQSVQPKSAPATRIAFDIHRLRLSDLCKLKELARQTPGTSLLEIAFWEGEKAHVLKADIAYSIAADAAWLPQVLQWSCAHRLS